VAIGEQRLVVVAAEPVPHRVVRKVPARGPSRRPTQCDRVHRQRCSSSRSSSPVLRFRRCQRKD